MADLGVTLTDFHVRQRLGHRVLVEDQRVALDMALGARRTLVDPHEPDNLATAIATLGLEHVVITSVDRDDLKDGGANQFVQCIEKLRVKAPGTTIEVLTPDFKGSLDDLATVVAAGPDVFAHNIETVERLHRLVRPQAKYERTLAVLRHARSLGAVTKSGIMLGLGETDDEVVETMRDLAAAGVEIVNLGQYMRPSNNHLPVMRWVRPEEFDALKERGMAFGFAHIEAGPLVRSSYRADQQAKAANLARLQGGAP
jgi:lipoic acid synthetase